MTEIEKIARAQMYIEKLAQGIDPLTDKEVSENDVINNVRISRCMFYVSGILKQIVDSKGKFKIESPNRIPFVITPEQLANFEYSEYPISVTEITKRLNALIDTVYVKELKNGVITEWLVEIGMLTNITMNNKTRKRPSATGESIGITVEHRTNQYGTPYEGVYYNLNAQRFIVDNIDAVINMSNIKSAKK